MIRREKTPAIGMGEKKDTVKDSFERFIITSVGFEILCSESGLVTCMFADCSVLL